ncbi:delta-lactam-biosynthetic de-N-acetylase [Bacillus canaveralius]|nr:delta-lactam-biosynthetic de-N-acetylase [Bacillus canaveralius]
MKNSLKTLLILILLPLMFQNSAAAETANSPIHWGIKRAANEIPAEAGKPLDQLLERYDAFYKGDPRKKDIYLTFDNGYENGYTGQILDVLKKENVPAAFFITGHYLKTAPDLVKRMSDEGHTIGNHSWHHPDLTKVSDERLKEELETVRSATAALTGKKQMIYLRPPRGIFSERTLALAKQEGYTHVFWSLAYIDWQTDRQKGADYAYSNIMKQIHPGAVLLLHTVSKDNTDALESVIRDLKKRGYTFKSLDDLRMEMVIQERMLY